jgi:hypothetical protein
MLTKGSVNMIKIPDFDPNSTSKSTTPESREKAEAWSSKHRQKADEQDNTTRERIATPPPPPKRRRVSTVPKP